MLRHLEAGRAYSFLTMADSYLRICPEDHYARLMAAREYLQLGLVTPAKELLEESESVPGAPGEFAEVRRSLDQVGGRVVPWSKLRSRFDANLAALAGRGVDPSAIRSAWESESRRYDLFLDQREVYQVRERDVEGVSHWYPSLADHAAEASARALPDDVRQNMPGPYLFEGLELGWYFPRIHEATRDTFLGYSCALFIVERDPARLAVVLHLQDWREIAADPRVFWCFGERWPETLRALWNDNVNLPFPRHAITAATHVGSVPTAAEVVTQAVSAREATCRESLTESQRRYARRDLRYWSERFDEALSGRGEPLRILAAVSTHTTFLQHSMRDAQRAFETLGHRCVVLSESRNFESIGPLCYHRAIRELDPDVFFILDHLRPEFGGLIPTNLPILSWDQDQLPHVFTVENMKGVAAHDFVAGCSKARWVRAGCNPRQFLASRVPTCPEQFSGAPLSREEMDRYQCDVSYVSHASQTPLEFHRQERGGCGDPRFAAVLDACFELLPPMLARHRVAGWGVAQSVVDEACRRCGVTIPDPEVRSRLMWWYVWRLGDRLFRHEALEWVADWARKRRASFRIYGNGWEKHPTLSAFAAGPAQNGRELLCIHRASRINLQLMPAGFVHQRALDGLASGGFFLTRLTPGDVGAATLRALVRRVHELGIGCVRELMSHADAELVRLLRDYQGDFLHLVDVEKDDFLHELLVNAELPTAEELFPRFSEIAFNSAEQFAVAADRFLQDDCLRFELSEPMREAVLAHLSYRPTMELFLRLMAEHLRESAFRQGSASNQS